jgi:hypothetical protein
MLRNTVRKPMRGARGRASANTSAAVSGRAAASKASMMAWRWRVLRIMSEPFFLIVSHLRQMRRGGVF